MPLGLVGTAELLVVVPLVVEPLESVLFLALPPELLHAATMARVRPDRAIAMSGFLTRVTSSSSWGYERSFLPWCLDVCHARFAHSLLPELDALHHLDGTGEVAGSSVVGAGRSHLLQRRVELDAPLLPLEVFPLAPLDVFPLAPLELSPLEPLD